MRRHLTLLLLPLILACGESEPENGKSWADKRTEYALPVRLASPQRDTVMDYVETQSTLETDRHANIYAEVDGKIVAKLRDVGDRVGGDEPMLLARIDDRDLALALKDAQIKLKEAKGRTRELELARQSTERELEQSRIGVGEAEAIFKRTSDGITDGTISAEEHERATFARRLAEKKVSTAELERDKAEVALELGGVAVEQYQVARDRAAVSLERATLRSPLPGIVTLCNAREGERIRTGDLLYRIEDEASLIVYGNLPVRQATRVKPGDPAILASTATDGDASGKVTLVSPVVDKDSGTVSVKVQVEPSTGFKPGLFVALRIVVATRDEALVVPKRAILHDDEEGAYLFTVKEDRAVRVPVKTGFEGDGVIEIVEGITESTPVVIEGQDTITDGAKVDVKDATPPPAEE